MGFSLVVASGACCLGAEGRLPIAGAAPVAELRL